MSLSFIEKYRAKTLNDIKGQELVIREVEAFLRLFPKRKALILNGPVGTGKTSIALAFAKEHNKELFELNASDLRNRQKLDEILRPAILQQSFFKKGKLILMDEADGISSTEGGGLAELIVLIEKTCFPIIITTNDIWQQKFSLLRRKCQLVNLKELKETIVVDVLNEVLRKEKKIIKQSTINLIAKHSRGDARAALNDLQTALSGEEEFLTEIAEREKQESIFNAMKKVFQEEPNEKTLSVYDNTQIELNEITLWIEENIPAAYSGKSLFKAFDSLSKADLFKGRIYRQQYWRFLVYQNFFLSAGISSAAKLKDSSFIKYQKPSRILKIWLSNQKNQKKKSIIMKYASFSHMSKKKAMKESFFLPFIIDKKAQKILDLNKDEKKFLEEKKQEIIGNITF